VLFDQAQEAAQKMGGDGKKGKPSPERELYNKAVNKLNGMKGGR